MPVCGPKFSVCCSIISVWGIIMLVLMGIFLYTHSVAFGEDILEEPKPTDTVQSYGNSINNNFTRAAYNCWIAALLYVVSLAFSVQQYFSNRRSSLSV